MCSCQAAEVCQPLFPKLDSSHLSAGAKGKARKQFEGEGGKGKGVPSIFGVGSVKCKRDTAIQTRITCSSNFYDLLILEPAPRLFVRVKNIYSLGIFG